MSWFASCFHSKLTFVTTSRETKIKKISKFSNFIIFKDQSYLFKDGANPGFHEAVAGVFALASQTPDYFKQLGLISSDIDINDEETNINTLFDMALDR